MKLHFSKKESIYTVFKTIKKIPTYKAVSLSFDADHPLFEHERWGRQLKEVVDQHDINATIYVTNQSMKQFFQVHGFSTIFKHKHIFQKWRQHIHAFIFTTQKFHTNLIFKNSYISYLIITSEAVVIGFILYFFWGLISPNATINIQPARRIETIVYNYAYIPSGEEETTKVTASANSLGGDVLRIPYYEGSIPFDHRLTINVENIEFSTTQAQGVVTLFNTTDELISLLPQTTLVTPTDIVFKTDARVTIPPGTLENPGKNSITVSAQVSNNNGVLIGELGNIPQDTVLRIKNLPESMEEQRIYATANKGFTGGSTTATGSVISQDIASIEEKILSYMEEKKKEVLQNNIIEKEHFILLYEAFIGLVVEEFITTSRVGDTTSFIEGEVKAHITYRYVKQADIIKAVDTYLQQRTSSNFTLLTYDFNSLALYDIHKETDTGVLYIPTKLNVIRGYNFEHDMNHLVPEIKAKIAGKNSQETTELLLAYDEIDDVSISISPPWYDTLPDVSSRITLRVFSK